LIKNLSFAFCFTIQRFKVLRMSKFLVFFLFSLIAIQACSQKPAETNTANSTVTPSATNNTPSATQNPSNPAPAPSNYASEKEGWLVDLDEAYAISQKEKKPILANFTGSDWCGWCKKLDADVFSKPEFQEWAKKNVVLLELDFPRKKQIPQKNQQQNYAMQQALQISGYPTIWLMTLDKNPSTGQFQINPLGKTGYTPDPAQFIATLTGFMKQG